MFFGFQPSLCVLNVSGNHLNSLVDMFCLDNLTQLMAVNNQLADLKVSKTTSLSLVYSLYVHGNDCFSAGIDSAVVQTVCPLEA